MSKIFRFTSVPLRRSSAAAIVAVSAMAVGACASGAANVPYSPSNFGAPDAVVATKLPATIIPGDKLQVRVYQEDTLSGRCRPMGTSISLSSASLKLWG